MLRLQAPRFRVATVRSEFGSGVAEYVVTLSGKRDPEHFLEPGVPPYIRSALRAWLDDLDALDADLSGDGGQQ